MVTKFLKFSHYFVLSKARTRPPSSSLDDGTPGTTHLTTTSQEELEG